MTAPALSRISTATSPSGTFASQKSMTAPFGGFAPVRRLPPPNPPPNAWVRYASRGVKRRTSVVAVVLGPLPQRRKVVENPEGASGRRGDQVALVHLEVGDRRDRQVQLEPRPRLPPLNEM